MKIGYFLSCEEYGPAELLRQARLAEESGFDGLWISDHFHPWNDAQGQSPFVWSVIGALSQACSLPVTTAVTCPTMRINPVIVAQAAATSAVMLDGKFVLGIGSGEALNEHVLGDAWPEASVRLEMLEEAVEVIRELWTGELTSHYGKHYTVENARIYTLPERLPPIHFAGAGKKAAEVAGRCGDGFIGTTPDADTLRTFAEAGGEGKPRYGQMTVCWAADEAEARSTALEWWPNAGLPGQLGQELPLPSNFEQAAEMVDEDDVAESVACGPDPGKHVEMIEKYREAGYDHIYIHQVGPDQEGFFRFYSDEVLPKL